MLIHTIHLISIYVIWLPTPLAYISNQEKRSCRDFCAKALPYEDDITRKQLTCVFAKQFTNSDSDDSIYFYHCGDHLDNKFHQQRKDLLRKFLYDVFREASFKYYGPLGFSTKDSGAILCETALVLYQAGYPYLSHAHKKYEGTNCSKFNPVIFYPDFHFIHSEGFKHLINSLDHANIPFHNKIKKVIWRGATTGKTGPCETLIRVKICEAARNISWLDFGISRNLPVCRGRPTKSHIPEIEWIRYRGILDIDGNANAWGLFWRLFSGSVIFRVESSFTNAYIDKMRPWVHYIPVSRNFSELANNTRIVLSDDPADVRLLQDITSNARSLGKPFTYASEVNRVARELNTFPSRGKVSF